MMTDIPQALEGKDVKDLLLNVGSGGGGAAVASGAAPAAGGADAPEEAKEEEKEEGIFSTLMCVLLVTQADAILQRRKSQTRIWVSDFSTKGFRYLSVCIYNAWLGLSSFGAPFAWTSCFHRMSKLIQPEIPNETLFWPLEHRDTNLKET
jgi:hypothetical protein